MYVFLSKRPKKFVQHHSNIIWEIYSQTYSNKLHVMDVWEKIFAIKNVWVRRACETIFFSQEYNFQNLTFHWKKKLYCYESSEKYDKYSKEDKN